MSRINIDGNMAALARYELEQDRLQKLDDRIDEVMTEIYDTPAWLEQVITDAPDDVELEEAVEDAARKYVEEESDE